MPFELRRDVIEQGPPAQRGNLGLQAHRVAQPKKVNATDAYRQTRAEAGGPSRVIERSRAAPNSRQLAAATEIEGVFAGFVQVEQDILAFFPAVGILEGSLHFREDSQVIQSLLTLGNPAL